MRPDREQDGVLVLVVDDEPMMRMFARDALEKDGFGVEEAADGREALAVFRLRQPDIVLMDVNMPVLDGFTACSRLRDMSAGRHTPILMMTGLEDVESIKRAYEVGATDFVNKPINWLILARRVEYMLRASRSAQDLREHQAKLANAQRIAGLGYWEWNIETDELTLSPELHRILGLPPDDPQSERLEWFVERIHEDDRKTFRLFAEELQKGGKPQEIEYRLVRPDASQRHVQQFAEAILNDEGRAARITGTVQDITERKHAEEKIRFLAYYDGLTGLPNRRAFAERLELALAAARRRGDATAILFLDLDRFKQVNDTLGHNTGDHLLQLVADRLLGCVRSTDCVGRPLLSGPSDLVSRFGGDEFVILLSDMSDARDAAVVAARLSEALSEPFRLHGRSIFVTGSIGIAISPHDGRDGESLIKNADTAMYHAKARGGNTHQYYAQSMNARALERLALESDLSRALERGELELFYQPIFDIGSGTVVGAEALLRWRHPEHGLLKPAKFIPLAEQTGLIIPIGDWALRTACRQAKRWREAGLASLRVAVNLSGRQFRQADLAARVGEALEAAGLEPRQLDLEITESILMEKGSETVRCLQSLKSLGVRLSIDDFGTGYSSLGYLMQFPLTALKIDRSFLRGVPDDREHIGITRAVIHMARSLDLHVVAEGVETPDQVEFLRAERCHEMQGFHFQRPLPADQLSRMLRERGPGLLRGTAVA